MDKAVLAIYKALSLEGFVRFRPCNGWPSAATKTGVHVLMPIRNHYGISVYIFPKNASEEPVWLLKGNDG